eukprot:TRINITY_DN19070_c0_g3_i1.p1 TRINITY_DN19070_c0_g3~~TRINITY_DN19070_c0_g3_i1.p1  ORF type:complete len:105 (-),score=12.23 TRINITY_DN19070_c0_g3_i1:384-698(-)
MELIIWNEIIGFTLLWSARGDSQTARSKAPPIAKQRRDSVDSVAAEAAVVAAGEAAAMVQDQASVQEEEEGGDGNDLEESGVRWISVFGNPTARLFKTKASSTF